jgi:ABC-type lipoprotein release transport system permease subunit
MGLPVQYNLRNLVERKGTTLMTAIGIALTVAVLITSVAMSNGMDAVFAGSGHPRQVVVLRKGTDSELNSQIKEDWYQVIRQTPGIAPGEDGQPLASPEAQTVVNLPSVDNPNGMNVTVRGLLPVGMKMRENAVLKSGRWNEPGKREVVVGDGIAARYPAARVGQKLKFGRGEWDVVGEFRDGDSAANSEIWADLNQLRGDFEREGGCNSVLVRLTEAEAAKSLDVMRATRKTSGSKAEEPSPPPGTFMAAVESDQRIGVSTFGEREYYKQLTKSSSGEVLQFIGRFVALVMAIGAGFAASNTMYAAVSRRSREIATLRAIGFGRGAILRSFLLESIFLALIGAAIGILIALPVNNVSAGVGNWQTFSETAFKFKIDWRAIVAGLIFATVIGALGGLLPAWSASRKNVVTAMREM